MGFFDRWKTGGASESDEETEFLSETPLKEKLVDSYVEGAMSFSEKKAVLLRMSKKQESLSLRWDFASPLAAAEVWQAIAQQCDYLAHEGVVASELSIRGRMSANNTPGMEMRCLSESNVMVLEAFYTSQESDDCSARRWAEVLGDIAEKEGLEVSEWNSENTWHVRISWKASAIERIPVSPDYATFFEDRFFDACEARYSGAASDEELSECHINAEADAHFVFQALKRHLGELCDTGYSHVKVTGLKYEGDDICLAFEPKMSPPMVIVEFPKVSINGPGVMRELEELCSQTGFATRSATGSRIGSFFVRWMPEEMDSLRDSYEPTIREAYEEGVPLEDLW